MSEGGTGARRQRRAMPVTNGQLPVIRCEICQRRLAYKPAETSASEVLTKHYSRDHSDRIAAAAS